MYYNNYAYVINHYNLLASKKNFYTKIVLNKQTLQLTKALYRIGAIKSFILTSNLLNKNHKYIKFSLNMFKNEPFFKHIKLVSKPSQNFSTKLSTLKIINSSKGNSILLLNTSRGILTDKEALSIGVGGKILCIIS